MFLFSSRSSVCVCVCIHSYNLKSERRRSGPAEGPTDRSGPPPRYSEPEERMALGRKCLVLTLNSPRRNPVGSVVRISDRSRRPIAAVTPTTPARRRGRGAGVGRAESAPGGGRSGALPSPSGEVDSGAFVARSSKDMLGSLS